MAHYALRHAQFAVYEHDKKTPISTTDKTFKVSIYLLWSPEVEEDEVDVEDVEAEIKVKREEKTPKRSP
jgi:hypothetical protein